MGIKHAHVGGPTFIMTIVRVDFETYSELNLLRVGAHAYASHPSTDLNCMSWSIDDDESEIWLPGMPFPYLLAEAIFDFTTLVEAHGANFEDPIWNLVAMPKYGFPPIQPAQWRCSQAQAGFRALPLGMDNLAKALRLPVQKDMAGNRAMKRIAKPDPKTGKRLTEDSHFDLYQQTYSYCMDDNRVERLASKYCGPLPSYELPAWQADRRMQARGIRIDQELCHSAIAVAGEYSGVLTGELCKITKEDVQTAGQRDRILTWLNRNGLCLPDLTADVVDAFIPRHEKGSPIRRVLEIRRYLSRSSHTKYARALICLSPDGRSRGATQYYGTTPGRNAGRLWQPLNMRRPVFCKDTEAMASAIKTRDLNVIEMVGGANVMEVLADAVRGIIIPAEGHELCAGDYSAIQSVITAAMANETTKLDVFRRGEDPYCWFASKVVGREVLGKKHPDFSAQDDKDRQESGKPGELSFGFAGGVGAYRNIDKTGERTDEEIEKLRDIWRDNHPRTKDMWNALDYCAKGAVMEPGQPFVYTPPDKGMECAITFVCKGDFLLLQLPSGRRLHYFKPTLKETLMPWTTKDGDPIWKPTVHYWTSQGKQWRQVRGWRGQWTENVAMAIERDLMVIGVANLEAAGYPPILTVYDEGLTEPKLGRWDREEFVQLMLDFRVPYVEDWPIRCEAWAGPRYKKA